MMFPSKEVLDRIKEFDGLPSTEEKEAIENEFLTDEIGTMEFASLAGRYIEKVKEQT